MVIRKQDIYYLVFLCYNFSGDIMQDDVLINLFTKYKFSDDEKTEILDIIENIYKHSEFQKRMSNNFLHHGNITLGEHILEDTLKTYMLSKKYKNNNRFDLSIALKISMLHDLYTLPWQNNDLNKANHFLHYHGFRHPVEAVINAINWFPEIFIDNITSKKIIDGIIHHMYPLPVSKIKSFDSNEIELKNYELVNNLSNMHKEIILWSCKRFRRSKYTEGRIVSKADKLVSIHQIRNLESAKALITGKNNKIK